jgi:hypothetical protein
LIGPHIYVVGSLGYLGQRRFGQTQVFRLDTRDFSIERVETRGEGPGWIYGHRAEPLAPAAIRVSGGNGRHAGGRPGSAYRQRRGLRVDVGTGVWSAAGL